MKRPALQNKRDGVLRMVFRARKVFGTFEKQDPEQGLNPYLCDCSVVLFKLSYQINWELGMITHWREK